jgi:hypothetical protein
VKVVPFAPKRNTGEKYRKEEPEKRVKCERKRRKKER